MPAEKVLTMDKVTEYAALVAARKACHRCAGLSNPRVGYLPYPEAFREDR